MLVWHTVEFGDASPKEDWIRPAENPYMSSQVLATLGDSTLNESSFWLKSFMMDWNYLSLPGSALCILNAPAAAPIPAISSVISSSSSLSNSRLSSGIVSKLIISVHKRPYQKYISRTFSASSASLIFLYRALKVMAPSEETINEAIVDVSLAGVPPPAFETNHEAT